MNKTGCSLTKQLTQGAFSALFSLSVFFLSSTFVRAEYTLGNYGALALDPQVGFDYSSNIALNSGEVEDVIFFFRPLLRYRYNAGAFSVNASAGYNFRRYNTYDQNDADNFLSRLTIVYPYGPYNQDKRFDLVFDGQYKITTSPDATVQAITKSETLDLSLLGRYYVSDRTYLRSGVEYLDRVSLTGNFRDVVEVSVPIEFFYKYSEDLDLGVGYRYQTTTLSGSSPKADSTDHAVYLSAIGRVLPSVVAEARIGMESRRFDHSAFDDETGSFIDAILTWEMSEQTSVEFSAGNEFETTIENISVEVAYVGFAVQHDFNEKISGSLGFGYEESDYLSGRSDEEWSVMSGATYSLIENVSTINVRLGYADRTSSRAISSYDVVTAHFEISYLF